MNLQYNHIIRLKIKIIRFIWNENEYLKIESKNQRNV